MHVENKKDQNERGVLNNMVKNHHVIYQWYHCCQWYGNIVTIRSRKTFRVVWLLPTVPLIDLQTLSLVEHRTYPLFKSLPRKRLE